MRYLYILIGLLVCGGSLYSQAPDIEWQKLYGGSGEDYFNKIISTVDGGYIIAGETNSNNDQVKDNHGLSDVWILKINKDGDIQWSKCYGGSNGDVSYDIVESGDGGYVFTGFTLSNDGDVTNSYGYSDLWVVKIDEEGNIKWQKSFGGSDTDYAISICRTEDGSIVLAGSVNSMDGTVEGKIGVDGNSDVWIIKLDKDGNLLWQKCLGGYSGDDALSVKVTSDNCLIAAGRVTSSSGDVQGNHGFVDVWIVKLDMDGKLLWQKCLGGQVMEWAFDIFETRDKGFIVAAEAWSDEGNITGVKGSGDYWIIKLDKNGDMIWQKTYGGLLKDQARSVVELSNGYFIVSGFSASEECDVRGNNGSYDIWVMMIDKQGGLVWQKPLGGADGEESLSAIPAINGGVIIAGVTASTDGFFSVNHGGLTDAYLVKLLGYSPHLAKPEDANRPANINNKECKRIKRYSRIGMDPLIYDTSMPLIDSE